MGILNKVNFQKRLRTLRTLDFDNVDPREIVGLDIDTSREPITEHAEHQPMPNEKPDPRAQWDDVHGCWIVWNLESEQWEQIAAG